MKETKQKFTEAEATVILARMVREYAGARLVESSTEKAVVSRRGRKIAKLISDGHGMWVSDSGNVTETP
jgi:hypothetical protein